MEHKLKVFMKKVTVVVLLAMALLALALCGCSGNGILREDGTAKPNADERFICDDSAYTFETVVDSYTGVTYLVWKSGGSNTSKGGITVLVNADGTPILSEEVR